ncbi:PIN domain-containing protein [Luteococcus sanguinis]|uniref:PIN domain-containing protein n=1 Tax=Luteococcus sanguinis TaxID=174038 RepID=A0ABW1X173_9ACTN
MAFPAFLDTCTLFGAALCDTLLSIAERGAFTPYWSPQVLVAVERAVVERGHASQEGMARRVRAMDRAFPTASVTGYESLVPTMTNHPGDRHVLAACVVSPAQTLVTFNIKDFPSTSVQPYDVEVVHPDAFLLDQLDLHPDEVQQAVAVMLKRNQRPPQDTVALADLLELCGTPRFAAALRELPQRIPSAD